MVKLQTLYDFMATICADGDLCVLRPQLGKQAAVFMKQIEDDTADLLETNYLDAARQRGQSIQIH